MLFLSTINFIIYFLIILRDYLEIYKKQSLNFFLLCFLFYAYIVNYLIFHYFQTIGCIIFQVVYFYFLISIPLLLQTDYYIVQHKNHFYQVIPHESPVLQYLLDSLPKLNLHF